LGTLLIAPKIVLKICGKKASEEEEKSLLGGNNMASKLINIPEDVGKHIKDIKYKEAYKTYE